MNKPSNKRLGLLVAALGIALAIPGFSAPSPANAATATADAQQHPHLFSHQKADAAWPAMADGNSPLLTLLKTDEDTLRSELRGGKSLAQIAKERGVDKQKVIDLLVAQQNAKLDEAVKQGKVTEDQAKQWRTGIQERTRRIVDGEGGKWRGHHRSGHYLQDAAQVLGMTPKALVEELKKGKTVVQIGKEKGIAEAQIVDQLLAKEKTRIEKRINHVWGQAPTKKDD
jgi:hypothetical protein